MRIYYSNHKNGNLIFTENNKYKAFDGILDGDTFYNIKLDDPDAAQKLQVKIAQLYTAARFSSFAALDAREIEQLENSLESMTLIFDNEDGISLYSQYNLPLLYYSFIKVDGEDGTFFDYVRKFAVPEHIKLLQEEGYTAEPVSWREVPPCRFRVFGDFLKSYKDGKWLGGKDFYITKEPV